jgi:hypothetical protein
MAKTCIFRKMDPCAVEFGRHIRIRAQHSIGWPFLFFFFFFGCCCCCWALDFLVWVAPAATHTKTAPHFRASSSQLVSDVLSFFPLCPRSHHHHRVSWTLFLSFFRFFILSLGWFHILLLAQRRIRERLFYYYYMAITYPHTQTTFSSPFSSSYSSHLVMYLFECRILSRGELDGLLWWRCGCLSIFFSLWMERENLDYYYTSTTTISLCCIHNVVAVCCGRRTDGRTDL